MALTAMCLALLAPVTLVDVPPLLDYPNHLARAFVLAFGSADPVLSAFYKPHWSIVPNLATDVILPPMLRALPHGTYSVHLAGRVVVGLFLLLPVLGTVAYSRAAFGRPSWWPIASGLIAYNAALLQGFLNFSASIGLALLCAAAWIRWRRRFPARVVCAACAATVVLFFCHLMGLGFFLLLTACAEIEAGWPSPRDIARAALGWLPLPVLPALLYAASGFAGVDAEPRWQGIGDKLAHLLDPVINYDLWLDLLAAAAIAGFLVVAIGVRRARVPIASRIAIPLLFALYLAAPFDFKGTAAFDMRFAILAATMLFAGILPVFSGRGGALAAGLFAALFATRMAVLGVAWSERATDLAQLRHTIADIPAGSRVYLTSVGPADAPGYWRTHRHGLLSDGTRTDYHLPALLLIEHRAFWPYLFAFASQQPIELTPEYMALAEQTEALPDAGFVAACRSQVAPPELDSALCGYDYVLMLEPAALPDPRTCAPRRLSLMEVTDMAALFRVAAGNCRPWAGSDRRPALTRPAG